MSIAILLQVAAIGGAGALGALSRYLLGRFIAERVSFQFPLGTLLINVTGAFAIGILFALVQHKLMSPALQSILATGFLGGYTTFSTMSWEATQLVRGGSTQASMLYLGSNVLIGLAAAALGLMVGGWL